jgi:hypothetical protein
LAIATGKTSPMVFATNPILYNNQVPLKQFAIPRYYFPKHSFTLFKCPQ